MSRFAIFLVGACTALAPPLALRAEVFQLRTGGQIEGRLVNPAENPRQNYVVQTAGGQVTLAAAQVEKVVEITPAQKRYQELLPRVPATAAGHWTMAEWCKGQGLAAERTLHLEQVLKYDPDHAAARAALGYGRIDDRWVKTDEYMRGLGYVLYKGVWRMPQEIALEEKERQQAEVEKNWKMKLRMWRGWIGKRRNDEAVAELQALKDPAAAAAVADLLKDEGQPEVKLLYLRVLARLNTPPSTLALLNVALYDDDSQLRDTALDALRERADPGVVRMCVQKLKERDNETVNRAATALGRLGSSDVILPLIEALVTRHRQTLGGGPSGGTGINYNSGSGGLAVGGGPKILEKEIRNGAVLNALLVLTGGGVNFHYDENAWRDWYAQQRAPKNVNLRRDE